MHSHRAFLQYESEGARVLLYQPNTRRPICLLRTAVPPGFNSTAERGLSAPRQEHLAVLSGAQAVCDLHFAKRHAQAFAPFLCVVSALPEASTASVAESTAIMFKEAHDELRPLLHSFQDVFAEPTSLRVLG
jgi:hypothetical protein